MLRACLLLLALFAYQLVTAEEQAQGDARMVGNVHFSLGFKSLSDDTWGDDFVDQVALGVGVDLGNSDWPVLFTIDSIFSASEKEVAGLDHYVYIGEFAPGIKKEWAVSDRSYPFMGVGLAFITAVRGDEIAGHSDSYDTEDDTALGLWISAGVNWKLSHRSRIGFIGRYSFAELEIDDVEYDADAVHIAFTTSIHW